MKRVELSPPPTMHQIATRRAHLVPAGEVPNYEELMIRLNLFRKARAEWCEETRLFGKQNATLTDLDRLLAAHNIATQGLAELRRWRWDQYNTNTVVRCLQSRKKHMDTPTDFLVLPHSINYDAVHGTLLSVDVRIVYAHVLPYLSVRDLFSFMLVCSQFQGISHMKLLSLARERYGDETGTPMALSLEEYLKLYLMTIPALGDILDLNHNVIRRVVNQSNNKATQSLQLVQEVIHHHTCVDYLKHADRIAAEQEGAEARELEFIRLHYAERRIRLIRELEKWGVSGLIDDEFRFDYTAKKAVYSVRVTNILMFVGFFTKHINKIVTRWFMMKAEKFTVIASCEDTQIAKAMLSRPNCVLDFTMRDPTQIRRERLRRLCQLVIHNWTLDTPTPLTRDLLWDQILTTNVFLQCLVDDYIVFTWRWTGFSFVLTMDKQVAGSLSFFESDRPRIQHIISELALYYKLYQKVVYSPLFETESVQKRLKIMK